MPGFSGRGCGAVLRHCVQACLQSAPLPPSAGLAALVLLLLPHPAHAMHLAEGILPFGWAAGWTLSVLPLLALGVTRLRQRMAQSPLYSPFVAMLAAAVFVVSCMPVPVPIIGTCSHPCGTGLAAVLIGPVMTVLVTFVALLLQALFLAHGGLTTLGADIWSMGVVGGFVGYAIFHGLRSLRASLGVAAFAAGMFSDWATYAMTSFELASALHGAQPLSTTLGTLLLSFLPTQLPLGLLEGAFTAGAVVFISRRRPALLKFHALPAAPRHAMKPLLAEASGWPGVDEHVVLPFAEAAGRSPQPPLIPLEGDVLLFAFLCAGLVGGFLLGYLYRSLFVETGERA